MDENTYLIFFLISVILSHDLKSETVPYRGCHLQLFCLFLLVSTFTFLSVMFWLPADEER